MVADPSMTAVPSPQRGEYRKIQELASGGMGSVELSRVVAGPHAGELVAVKRLHPHLEREKHFADMFFDEARITAGLHHPNVVEIYDWGQDTTGRYLALEFVPGDSLLGLIREAKKQGVAIPIDLGLFVVAKTAEGLHAAHELRNEDGDLRHLVHRDVTPSNILLGINGQVKLIDFGVAKARDRLSHTSTGTIKGKFGYMSPEQARGFPIDRRSDVFSLGIVLWETLALRRLFRSESELEIMRMIVEDPPTPIRAIRPEVPPAVEAVISAALAKNRDDRLGSCSEMAEFLWEAYHDAGYTAAEPELAEFFRQVMPERFNAVEHLLSGSDGFLEPSVKDRGSTSGSFSGTPGALDEVSGEVPRPVGAPLLPVIHPSSNPSLPAITASGTPAPVALPVHFDEPRRKSNRTALFLAFAAGVGVVGVAIGVGVATHTGPSAAVPATPATQQGATTPPAVPQSNGAVGNTPGNTGSTAQLGANNAQHADPGTAGNTQPSGTGAGSSTGTYATVHDPVGGRSGRNGRSSGSHGGSGEQNRGSTGASAGATQVAHGGSTSAPSNPGSSGSSGGEPRHGGESSSSGSSTAQSGSGSSGSSGSSQTTRTNPTNPTQGATQPANNGTGFGLRRTW